MILQADITSDKITWITYVDMYVVEIRQYMIFLRYFHSLTNSSALSTFLVPMSTSLPSRLRFTRNNSLAFEGYAGHLVRELTPKASCTK